MMDKTKMLEKVLTGAASLTIDHISFDDPCASMLVVDLGNIEDHIAKQAAGIAFYGSMARQAQRSLDEAKKTWKYRWSEMYGIVLKSMQIVDPKKKPTVTEIEAEIYHQFKNDIDTREAEINEKQRIADDTQVFFEAWQSKSFALNQLVNVAVAGLLNKDSYGGEDGFNGRSQNSNGNDDKVSGVINVLRRRNGQTNQ